MEKRKKLCALWTVVLCCIAANHTTRQYMIDMFSCNGQKWYASVLASSGENQATKFFRELDEMLLNAKEHLDLADGEKCILLLGETGVGKSTLANALCSGSNTIRKIKIHEEETNLVPSKQLFTKSGKLLFATGAGDHSITLYPEAAKVGREVLVDCPGFRDTGGESRDLINCIAISKLIHRASKVRLCLLISQSQITSKTGKQQMFEELLSTLLQLFNVQKIENISSDDLKKVQIVVTHLEGNKDKSYLQKKLKAVFQQLLSSDKHAAIEQMIENVALVDAADRVSQFKDIKRTWLGYNYSEDQTTVAALKSKLFDTKADMWFSPSDFARPLTVAGLRTLINMCEEIRKEAINAIRSDWDYEARVAALIRPLKKLQEYQFEGIKVDRYITEITNALNAKKAGEEKDKIIAKLRKGLEEAQKEFKAEVKEGFFEENLGQIGNKIGRGAGKIIDGVEELTDVVVRWLSK